MLVFAGGKICRWKRRVFFGSPRWSTLPDFCVFSIRVKRAFLRILKPRSWNILGKWVHLPENFRGGQSKNLNETTTKCMIAIRLLLPSAWKKPSSTVTKIIWTETCFQNKLGIKKKTSTFWPFWSPWAQKKLLQSSSLHFCFSKKLWLIRSKFQHALAISEGSLWTGPMSKTCRRNGGNWWSERTSRFFGVQKRY